HSCPGSFWRLSAKVTFRSPAQARFLCAIFFSLWMAGLIGCSKSKPGPDVVASVNGRKIMRAEVEKYYGNQTAGNPQAPICEQASSLRITILEDLIQQEIMLQLPENPVLI